MIAITRSRPAMALAVCAAAAYVVASILGCVAYAIVSTTNFATSQHLITAAQWMMFVAAAAALVGVSWAMWDLVLHERWRELWEVVAAGVGIFLIAIGSFVQAVDSPRTPESPRILLAIGLGLWAILAFFKAGQRSLAEYHAPTGVFPQAPLWAAAGVGLFVTSVGWGLPAASVLDKGLGIADGVVAMLGVTIVATVVLVAVRSRLVSYQPTLVAGLFLVAAAYGTTAIVGGAVYGRSPSLTGLRIGLPIAFFLIAVGVGLLGFTAWIRLRDLTVVSSPLRPGYWGAPEPARADVSPGAGVPPWVTEQVQNAPTARNAPVSPGPPTGPTAQGAWRSPQHCPQCGALQPPGAHFCPTCGARAAAPAPTPGPPGPG